MTGERSGVIEQQTLLLDRRPVPVPGNYATEIVKRLARVTAVAGYGAAVVFDDWTRIVEASLEALPNHLKAVARTGRWAEDTPETAEVFAQVRARYREGARPSAHRRVWENFSQAFALLLESAGPGLWGYADFDVGYMGPDVIGQVYMDFANYDPRWSAQYWTPWNVALLAARVTIPSGARDVHDRLNVTGSIICPKGHDMLPIHSGQNMLPVRL
jgi:hypothetical protein